MDWTAIQLHFNQSFKLRNRSMAAWRLRSFQEAFTSIFEPAEPRPTPCTCCSAWIGLTMPVRFCLFFYINLFLPCKFLPSPRPSLHPIDLSILQKNNLLINFQYFLPVPNIRLVQGRCRLVGGHHFGCLDAARLGVFRLVAQPFWISFFV